MFNTLTSPDVAFEFPSFKMLSALVSKRRVSERRVTFQVVADYSKKEAHVEMTTLSQVYKRTSKFRACKFSSLAFLTNGSSQERVEEVWMTGNGADRPTRFSVSVEPTSMHNLLSAFADSTGSMVFAVNDHEYALLVLKQYEVQVMYLLPHFNQN